MGFSSERPPREGRVLRLRRLGARSLCYCCLDPIRPTEGGGEDTDLTRNTRAPHFTPLHPAALASVPYLLH